MDNNHPGMPVGTYKDPKGIEQEVCVVYRDGKSSHEGTRRAYFYNADKELLRGHGFINEITFKEDLRKPWQSFLQEDNRQFIKNKKKYGESARKSATELAYARFLEKHNMPKSAIMNSAKNAKGSDLILHKKNRKQETFRQKSVPVEMSAGMPKRRTSAPAEAKKKQKLNSGLAVNAIPKPRDDTVATPTEDGTGTTTVKDPLPDGKPPSKRSHPLRFQVLPLNSILKRKSGVTLPTDSIPLFQLPRMKTMLKKLHAEFRGQKSRQSILVPEGLIP